MLPLNEHSCECCFRAQHKRNPGRWPPLALPVSGKGSGGRDKQRPAVGCDIVAIYDVVVPHVFHGKVTKHATACRSTLSSLTTVTSNICIYMERDAAKYREVTGQCGQCGHVWLPPRIAPGRQWWWRRRRAVARTTRSNQTHSETNDRSPRRSVHSYLPGLTYATIFFQH